MFGRILLSLRNKMDKQEYQKYLQLNENDTAARLEYADLLDELGEHEEADRMRKWPAAKTWLVEKCRQHGNNEEPLPGVALSPEAIKKHKDGVSAIQAKYPWLKNANPAPKPPVEYDDYDYDYKPMSYKKLIQLGHYGKHHGYSVSFGSSESLAYELNDCREEFWTNWSIVTGEEVELGNVHKGYFGCSC